MEGCGLHWFPHQEEGGREGSRRGGDAGGSCPGRQVIWGLEFWACGRCCDHWRTLTAVPAWSQPTLKRSSLAPPFSSLPIKTASTTCHQLSQAGVLMHGCLWKLCASTRSPVRGHSRPRVQRLTICTPSPHAEGLTGCQSPLAPSCLHLLSSSRSLW